MGINAEKRGKKTMGRRVYGVEHLKSRRSGTLVIPTNYQGREPLKSDELGRSIHQSREGRKKEEWRKER